MDDMKTIDSVCTYCGVGCDIAAHVNTKENKIVKVFAHPDGVVSQGKLCIKGKFGYDFVESDKRIRNNRIRKSFLEKNPAIKNAISGNLREFDDTWYETDLDTATTIASLKLKDIQEKYGRKSIASIGGARTNCESVFLFQKFTRHTLNSPHVDNCARVCHSPSLSGMKKTIGEGAATNPYNDIYNTEFMIVIGSNTTEAHPIIANRIIDVAREHDNLATFDVREIKLHRYSKYEAIMPHEANLLILNMLAYVIIDEELYHEDFIEDRTKGFEEYKQSIMNDPYANPDYFNEIEGYEYLSKMIRKVAREYALKKSMIFWGLGITEHLDGSYAVMAIVHLALMTGNVGKSGTGLMPLRGQNNVQGACDMGMLPYFDPDYQEPKEIGLMTPQLVDEMLEGRLKAVINISEDLTHIHPNLNKVERGLDELEFLMVQELFMTEVTSRADIVIGVRSAYEKTGVYVNAMRRLHLSQPLVECDLPDDWEVIQLLDQKMGGSSNYKSSQDVWDEVRQTAYRRFSGADYHRLEKHRKRGLQWPVHTEDTPILHQLDFRTDDGYGHFQYHQYKLRGMIEEISKKSLTGYYLSTGRTLAHYNNAAQTKQSEKLNSAYDEDVLLVCEDDASDFTSERVIVKTEYGQSTPLKVKFTNKVQPKTLFVTFHHAKSRVNAIFGDAADEIILTAAFKSVKVEIINC